MIPPAVAAEVARIEREQKSVTLTLNFKEGKVLSYEVTTKQRLGA